MRLPTKPTPSKRTVTTKKRITYLLLAITLLATAKGQPAEHHTYRLIDTADGLPDNEVKALLHLPDGRIGIRTTSTLSLYDGCEFRSFTPHTNAAYPMPYVAALPTAYVDSQQRLWLKESGHLLVFDLTRETYLNEVDSLLRAMGTRDQVCDFFIDAAGYYWMATAGGTLLRASNRGKTGEGYRCEPVKAHVRGLREVCRTEDGLAWLVYNNGQLVALNPRTGKVAGSQRLWNEPVQPRDFVQCASQGTHNWVMWDHGVAVYQPLERRWKLRHKDPHHVFTTISVTPDGTAYVSARKYGLLTVPRQGTVSVQTSFSTTHGETITDDVESIMCGRDQVLLGLQTRGLCLHNANMQPFPFHTFSDMGLPAPGTYHIANSFAGAVCLTTGNSVFLWDAQRGLKPLWSGTEAEARDFINSYLDSRGRLWTGTFRNGLYRVNKGKVFHLQQGEDTSEDINYNIVRGFLEDRHHRIWVNFHGGIGRFNEQTERIVPVKDRKLEKYKVVNAWATDSHQRIWAATNTGLFRYSPTDGKVSLPQDLVSDPETATKLDEPCKCILVDSRGHVWVGQPNGLYIIDPQKRTTLHYGKEQGMPGEMIQGIMEDRQGNVWVSTANGLCRMQPSGGSYAMMVFDGHNRLGNCRLQPQATGRDAEGKLLFGCAEGFYAVDPASVKSTPYTGHPIMTSLVVNRHDILPGKKYNGHIILEKALVQTRKIILRHNENFISLRLSGLNFDMPHHTRYRYRLKGLEEHWTETTPADGIGQAVYTKLPPGEYEFETYTAGPDMKWSSQSARLAIVVEAPLWATWWANTFYLLLVAGAIGWTVRWKMGQKRKQMEAEKRRELEEMKLRFFTNISHEFRTLLTLIITPIGALLRRTEDTETRQQLNTVNKNAGDLLQLVNELLDFRKLEMDGEQLHLAAGNLDELVKYTAAKFAPLAEQKGITLETVDDTGGLFILFDHDKVRKIVVNLLSNAFKYTKSGNVRVVIEKCLKNSRPYARIHVEDTGCGISRSDQKRIFDRFFRADDQAATNIGSGIGLNLVAEYVRLHGGHISVTSEPGRGSNFVVDIPADLKNSKAAESEKIEDTPPGTLTDKKILVIEDNDNFRNFLVRELGHTYKKVF